MKKFLWLSLLLLVQQAQAIEYGGGSADIFVLDEDDDSAANIVLQFGSALNKTLEWDVTNNRFNFSDSLKVGGNISATNYCDENETNCFTAVNLGEKQTLSFSGTTVSISDGNSVDLASINTDTTYTAGDGLNLNGTAFSSTLGTTIDSNEIVDGSIGGVDIADNAISTDKIGTSGAGDANKILTTDEAGNPIWERKAELSQNKLENKDWEIGGGSSGGFSQNGLATENERIWGETPFETRGILWEALPSGDSSSDGGWNHSNIEIDHTKTYRSMVWMKKTGDTAGTSYFGAEGGGVATYNLGGTANGNPYFWYGDLPELDKWYLLVGYIHGSGDTIVQSYGGIYDGVTGEKVINITDFKNGPTATTQTHRAYLFYNTNSTNRQYFWGPRFEEVTGTELPVTAFLPVSGGGGSTNITQLEATINNNVENIFTHSPDTNFERLVDVYYQDAETVQENSFWDVFSSEEGLYVQENSSITDFANDTIGLQPTGAYTPGTTNLALGSTAIGSDATRPFVNGNDNSTASFWYNQGGGPSAGQWWGVDLGTPKTVMRAQINWYSTAYHATNMRIEGSNDGTNWTTVSTVSPNGGNTTDETWDFTPATYRYWRFYCVTGNNATYFVIREGRFFEAQGGGFSTTPAYVTTGASKSFNTTIWSQINSIDLINYEPSGTSLKYLFSFDGRTTWYGFSGGSWSVQNLNNIETVGMTTAQVESLTAANWNAANGLNSGAGDFDYAVSVETSNTNISPTHTGIALNYGTETYWQKATESQARVRLLSDTTTSVQNLSGAAKLFKVNIIQP